MRNVVEFTVIEIENLRRAVAEPGERVLVSDVVSRAHAGERMTKSVQLVLPRVCEAALGAQCLQPFQPRALVQRSVALRMPLRRWRVEHQLAAARNRFENGT